jgi:hypothetical protein
MCASCGCGELGTRHRSEDLVLEDLLLAGRNQGLSLDQVIRNIASIGAAPPPPPVEAAELVPEALGPLARR